MDWRLRSLSGKPYRVSGVTRNGPERGGRSEGITFSIDVLPQTPQAEPMTVPRCNFAARAKASAPSAAMRTLALSSESIRGSVGRSRPISSSRLSRTPSAKSSPAASSSSFPGVRIVVTKEDAGPPSASRIRISSGSSTARTSSRSTSESPSRARTRTRSTGSMAVILARRAVPAAFPRQREGDGRSDERNEDERRQRRSDAVEVGDPAEDRRGETTQAHRETDRHPRGRSHAPRQVLLAQDGHDGERSEERQADRHEKEQGGGGALRRDKEDQQRKEHRQRAGDDKPATEPIGEPAARERPDDTRRQHHRQRRGRLALRPGEPCDPVERNEGVQAIEHDRPAHDGSRQTRERCPALRVFRRDGDSHR